MTHFRDEMADGGGGGELSMVGGGESSIAGTGTDHILAARQPQMLRARYQIELKVECWPEGETSCRDLRCGVRASSRLASTDPRTTPALFDLGHLSDYGQTTDDRSHSAHPPLQPRRHPPDRRTRRLVPRGRSVA